MNIWKKDPNKYIINYPGWDIIDNIYDKKEKKVFSYNRRFNISFRNFKHKCYTRYKYRGLAIVEMNNRKKRIRVNYQIKDK